MSGVESSPVGSDDPVLGRNKGADFAYGSDDNGRIKWNVKSGKGGVVYRKAPLDSLDKVGADVGGGN